jgi:hydroxymethylbilane synthase
MLLKGAVNLVVHSYKDIPLDTTAGTLVAAVPKREKINEAFVSRGETLETLPKDSIVGTISMRRAGQILHLRPDLQIKPLRGSVESRIRKVEEGEYDAAVLALAGLNRTGLQRKAVQIFDSEIFVPAPGQGALAVQIRSDDPKLYNMMQRLDDAKSHFCVNAERQVGRILGATCRSSFGASSTIIGEDMTLTAAVLTHDGKKRIAERMSGPWTHADKLAEKIAERLIENGADKIINTASMT